MTDRDIVALIKEGKTAKAFEAVYRNFPAVRKMILSLGGSLDDAKDIFQDSVIVFYRMSSRQDFVLTAAVGTLLYSISKRMWYKKIRDLKSREQPLSAEREVPDESTSIYEYYLDENETISIVEKMLIELGDPCRSLLEKFYYEKYSMKEIASEMGYSNEKTAKAQKYKCIERGKKILGEKTGLLKMLFQ